MFGIWGIWVQMRKKLLAEWTGESSVWGKRDPSLVQTSESKRLALFSVEVASKQSCGGKKSKLMWTSAHVERLTTQTEEWHVKLQKEDKNNINSQC